MLLHLRDRTLDVTDRTAIMGILNVSDDSPIAFSRVATSEAFDRARALAAAGAEVIDVGAHSTRTGGRDLTPDEEAGRVAPVIEACVREGLLTSVDTWTPAVARAAAEAGVHLLNDVTGATDPEMLAVAVEYHLPACVMHMRGQPKHHREADQDYEDINAEVTAFLLERTGALERAGAGTPWLDPGFGFGKSAADNLAMLDGLPALVAQGYPVLVSASRKGFLAELMGLGDRQDVEGLLEATLGFNTLAAAAGVHVVRVHDVAEVSRSLSVVNALRRHRAGLN
ncbi:MAG: dihydropteroate synthase [Dehalococcoidia bacterium]|nr:MAG: dihydropteroate synthase [Dehalococcoidia bacterium]